MLAASQGKQKGCLVFPSAMQFEEPQTLYLIGSMCRLLGAMCTVGHSVQLLSVQLEQYAISPGVPFLLLGPAHVQICLPACLSV